MAQISSRTRRYAPTSSHSTNSMPRKKLSSATFAVYLTAPAAKISLIKATVNSIPRSLTWVSTPTPNPLLRTKRTLRPTSRQTQWRSAWTLNAVCPSRKRKDVSGWSVGVHGSSATPAKNFGGTANISASTRTKNSSHPQSGWSRPSTFTEVSKQMGPFAIPGDFLQYFFYSFLSKEFRIPIYLKFNCIHIYNIELSPLWNGLPLRINKVNLMMSLVFWLLWLYLFISPWSTSTRQNKCRMENGLFWL